MLPAIDVAIVSTFCPETSRCFMNSYKCKNTVKVMKGRGSRMMEVLLELEGPALVTADANRMLVGLRDCRSLLLSSLAKSEKGQ